MEISGHTKYEVTLYGLTYEEDYHGHDISHRKEICSHNVEMPEETAKMLDDLFHRINCCNRSVELVISKV